MGDDKTSEYLNWDEEVKRLLKAELSRKGISHKELVNLLRNMGVRTTKASIDNKLSRGTFSAAFLVQCLRAIGCNALRIES